MHPNEIKLTEQNISYLMADALILSGPDGPHAKALDEQARRQNSNKS